MPAENTITPSPGATAGIMDQLKKWFAANPRLGKSLAAGLGSAAVGGGLTALSKRENETPAERRKRILKNALLAGGAGAGAVGLGDYALGQFKTVDPVTQDPITGPGKYIGGGIGGLFTLLGLNAHGRAVEESQAGSMVSNINKKLTDKEKTFDTHNKVQDSKRMRGDSPVSSRNPRGYAASKDLSNAEKEILRRSNDTSSKSLVDKIGRPRNKSILKSMEGVKGHPGQESPFAKILREIGAGPDELLNTGHVAKYDGLRDTKRFVKDILRRTGRRTFGQGVQSKLKNSGRVIGGAAIPFALINALDTNPELAANTIGRFTSAEDNNNLLENL